MRVIHDRGDDTSLSEAIGQTAEFCYHPGLKSFPQPAAVVFARFERDHVGPGHWWGFCEVRVPNTKRRAWIRYFAGSMRPEPDAVSGKLGWP